MWFIGAIAGRGALGGAILGVIAGVAARAVWGEHAQSAAASPASDPRSAALPIATLVPGYREDKPLEAARATVSDMRAQARPSSARPEWLELEPGDWKKLALWTALVLGVAVLGWMAWRLGAQMGKPSDDRGRADGETPR